MMNLGDDKGKIVRDVIAQYKPKTILELGGYCGYSGLLFAAVSGGQVHTIEPNKDFASIAHRIHQHAGLADRVTIHEGIIQTNEDFIKQHGPFDLIFVDHVKHLYLQDFLWLQERGAVRKGTVVVGDNIILPGAPDYLAYFQKSKDYNSTLYHANIEYGDNPDAVLVSERIN
jgi:catechol O-methyltransferase